MACLDPNYIAYDKISKKIVFLGRNKYMSDQVKKELEKQFRAYDVLMVPCGHCIECLKDRAKSWAIRCMLEASLYTDNYFVTLTYNDACNPGRLSKKDFRQFIKNVRNVFGPGVRYFGCGEYGPSTLRPHYHLILFNLKLDDVQPYCSAAKGGNYFISKKLENCWHFGHITLGEVSYGSCAYVAQYCMKKVGKNDGIFKTFQSMSTHPGLGSGYFDKRFSSIYECDACYLPDGKVVQPPRYFDKLLSKVDENYLESIKTVRINNATVRTADALIDHALSCDEAIIRYNRKISENHTKRKDL